MSTKKTAIQLELDYDKKAAELDNLRRRIRQEQKAERLKISDMFFKTLEDKLSQKITMPDATILCKALLSIDDNYFQRLISTTKNNSQEQQKIDTQTKQNAVEDVDVNQQNGAD